MARPRVTCYAKGVADVFSVKACKSEPFDTFSSMLESAESWPPGVPRVVGV